MVDTGIYIFTVTAHCGSREINDDTFDIDMMMATTLLSTF